MRPKDVFKDPNFFNLIIIVIWLLHAITRVGQLYICKRNSSSRFEVYFFFNNISRNFSKISIWTRLKGVFKDPNFFNLIINIFSFNRDCYITRVGQLYICKRNSSSRFEVYFFFNNISKNFSKVSIWTRLKGVGVFKDRNFFNYFYNYCYVIVICRHKSWSASYL